MKSELKELGQLKLSSSTKSATTDKFITKQHKEAVSNVEISCLAISKILILRNLF